MKNAEPGPAGSKNQPPKDIVVRTFDFEFKRVIGAIIVSTTRGGGLKFNLAFLTFN
jgi:hypothetical protein